MSFETLRTTLVSEFQNNWDSNLASASYENQQFNTSNKSWVLFSIVNGEGRSYGIDGSNKFVEDHGYITLNVNIPLKTGIKQRNLIFDLFNNIFEHKRFSGNIVTFSGTIRPLGDDEFFNRSIIMIKFRRNRNV